jgi:hypothetical protein
MPTPGDFESFVPAGLVALGVQADEVELAIMAAAHELYWPGIVGLLETDLSVVDAEPVADLSRPPEPA